MTAWVRNYVGRQHAPDGDGPARFSCWNLVRHVFRNELGIDMPPLVVAIEPISEPLLDNVAAIKQAARVSGMRRVNDMHQQPFPNDIVLLRSQVRLHCGVVVRANGRICVLHAAHDLGVVCQPWAEAIEGMTPELWRRA